MIQPTSYRKAVILGAAGFLGENLAHVLVARGFDLVCFDRIASLRWPAAARSLIGDFNAVPGTLLEELDQALVFHLVGSSRPTQGTGAAATEVRLDLAATIECLELTRGRQLRWIFISSGGTVYGQNNADRIDESSPTRPICSYAAAKLAIETYFALYREVHGTDYVVVRLANPYGPGQHPLRGQGVVSALLLKAMQGKTIEIWGDGSVVRDYIFVVDAVEGTIAAGLGGDCGGIYNVGSGTGRSIKQLIEVIEATLGTPVRVRHSPGRPFDVKRNVLDCARLAAQTGWTPSTPLESGLQQTAAWLRRNVADLL